MYKHKVLSFFWLFIQLFIVVLIALAFLACKRIAYAPYEGGAKVVSYRINDDETLSQIMQYETKFVADRKYYDFGQPVRLRFEITNLFTQTITLRSTSPITPAVDLMLQRITPAGVADRYLWSEAHPDRARQPVVLNPGESYTVEWEITPDQPGVYRAVALFVTPLLLSDTPPTDRIPRTSGGLNCIFYGVREDDPTAQALCSPFNVGQSLPQLYSSDTEPNTTPEKGP